jgi:serine/threonine protein kinase
MLLLTLHLKLNEGEFGEVFTTNDQHLVVKKLKDKEEGINEIHILNYLHSRESYSRYIIRMVESFYDKNDFLNIVFPRFEMSLYDLIYVENTYKKTSLEFRHNIAKQIIDGIAFLHENQIIHRDIKLSNILYNSHNGLINISDLDWACIVQNNNEKRETCAITLIYKCPELIFHHQIMNQEMVSYSYEVDIFSLGIVLFEVLLSETPFQYKKGMTHVDFLYSILNAWNPFFKKNKQNTITLDVLENKDFNSVYNFWKYNTTISLKEYTQDLGIISCMCFPNPKLRLTIQEVKNFIHY